MRRETDYHNYLQAIAYVFRHTDATQRRMWRRVRLPAGVPFRFVSRSSVPNV